MKKYLLGSAAIVALALATPAAAADLGVRYPTKAPPPVVAPIWNWTGFYIGINGGYGWGNSNWTHAVLGPEGSHKTDGGTVGGQIGYNWQVGQFVFGLEAQGNWADFSGSNVSLANPAFTNHTKIDAFGLFTGKLGYAWDQVLLYAKGGAAVVSADYSFGGLPGGGNASETRWGATVGAGIEYAFAPNWSAGLEYNHLFLESKNVTFNTGDVDRIKLKSDIFTARINYRFGGPVVTRY
ncbi:membrane protein [Afipia sp. P52-10]|jgi:outer membrane immunogenic protein|uniref:outer membrane protein n=1 Tax=Afipia sp. P52-10 TaxID=1429916 RepID=UPI0003DF4805|nr:outer membrane beta-barrel protein [Afipia sp. P52-10]ETR75220.1 membrane protein [Afipia sp. P52-10]